MRTFARDYGLGIALAILFIVSWVVQSLTGWVEFAGQQQSHGETAELFGPSGYFWTWMSATFENWQSEFLQLLWQVVGLAYFLYIGSPASKENDDRLEAKIDALLRINAGEQAEKVIENLDKHFERHDGVTPHAHDNEAVHNAGKGVKHVAAR